MLNLNLTDQIALQNIAGTDHDRD